MIRAVNCIIGLSVTIGIVVFIALLCVLIAKLHDCIARYGICDIFSISIVKHRARWLATIEGA